MTAMMGWVRSCCSRASLGGLLLAALALQGCGGDDKCKSACCECGSTSDCDSGLSCEGVYNSQGVWKVCKASATSCKCGSTSGCTAQ